MPRLAADAPMLGYLVNQYPMASQTFIRREIAAIEGAGRTVRRYAVRAWGEALVDEADRAEAARTRYLLAAGGLRLLLATLGQALRSPGRFARAVATAWRLGGRALRGRPVHFVYLAEACLLRAWLAQDRVQHLHVHFGSNSATTALLCRLLGGPPFSFTVHGPEEFDQPVGLALGEKIAHAAFAVAISSYGRSQLLRWAGLEDWRKVHVVRCGVDPTWLLAAPPPISTAPRLVTIGRLVEQKGQLLLVEAAAALRDRGQQFEIVVIGDGPLRPALTARIAELRLDGAVRLVGWQTGQQVREHLLAARGLVLPSFAEGLPVVAMEALALHRPVVATAIAGIPELVRPGVTGWLVPAGDAEALAAAMAELLAAPAAELARLGAAGAAAVARSHDAVVEAHRLLALIDASAR
jgi:glycosyltransferase involved in cell wall biosynthesis